MLPRFKNLSQGEIKIMNKNSKIQFALVLKGSLALSTAEITHNLKELFKVLRALIAKEKLQSLSIAKSEYIENVPWLDIVEILRHIKRHGTKNNHLHEYY